MPGFLYHCLTLFTIPFAGNPTKCGKPKMDNHYWAKTINRKCRIRSNKSEQNKHNISRFDCSNSILISLCDFSDRWTSVSNTEWINEKYWWRWVLWFKNQVMQSGLRRSFDKIKPINVQNLFKLQHLFTNCTKMHINIIQCPAKLVFNLFALLIGAIAHFIWKCSFHVDTQEFKIQSLIAEYVYDSKIF